MNEKEIESTLSLFRSFVFNTNDLEKLDEEAKSVQMQQCLQSGIIFDNMDYKIPNVVIRIAEDFYGKNSEQLNAAFHKSFKTVKDTPIKVLVAQQLMHYFSTYGLESLGLYNEDLIYIPREHLDLPELKDNIELTVLHIITAEELSDKIMTVINSSIALSTSTLDKICTLSDYIDLENNSIEDIKNRETRLYLYKKLEIIPKDPEEFLKYLIYTLTNNTLIIKNDILISTLKKSNASQILLLLNEYINNSNGYKKLASIFYRYKDLFLAFKRDSDTFSEYKSINAIINKIRRLANKHHRPMKPTIINKLTSYASMDPSIIPLDKIESALNKITIFKLISLYNTMTNRLSDNLYDMYIIRNKTVFIKDAKSKINSSTKIIRDLIYQELLSRLTHLKDKTVYIPENFVYRAPISEKQFVNNIPEGSYMTIKRNKNTILGIHWFNVDDERVDLDLHLRNVNQHYGWSAQYLNTEKTILYSGDITSAPKPNGATEVYWIDRNYSCNDIFMLTLNNFTGTVKDITYDFIIAESEDNQIERNYIIDPNNIKLKLNHEFGYNNHDIWKQTKSLGALKIDNDEVRFYFKDLAVDKSNITIDSTLNNNILSYIQKYMEIQLDLNKLLIDAGAKLVDSPEIENFEEIKTDDEQIVYKKVIQPCDIDLSLNKIDKTTIIKLLLN